MALGALRFERPGRRPIEARIAVTRRADRRSRVPHLEEREMLTLLERNEGSGMTHAACLRKVLAIHRARWISAVQDFAVRHQRFERRGVASMALLATDVVRPVS
jgi:hypothetical protein